MPWLFIDTHERGSMSFGWLGKPRTRLYTMEGRSYGLLSALARRMPIEHIRTADGVCVVSGPGPFSGIRAGVLAANMLAKANALPLVGVTADETADLDALSRRLEAGEYPPVSYVAPVYDAEPNITLPASGRV